MDAGVYDRHITPVQNRCVYELAQVNVAIMRAPLHEPSMAGFVAAFDAVARMAEESAGFVWRLRAETGHAVVDENQVVNVSVWRDYRSLHEFVYRSPHGRFVLRRTTWFTKAQQPSTALWWVPAGDRPDLGQALARLRHLRAHGPSSRAFTLRQRFTPDGAREPRPGRPRR
jgi:heme-degrading monooxygenase HmoA